jgi:putative flippase GtrA
MQTEIAERRRTTELADAVRRLAERLHVPTTMLKFVIVGGIGFLINETVLFLLYDGGLFGFLADKHESIDIGFASPEARLLFASIAAVEVAIICQFNLHERWTFHNRNRDGNIFFRFAKFNLGSIVSPIVTVLCVNVLTPEIRDAAGPDSIVGKVAPYLANGFGVVMGFSWNYIFTSKVIWRRHPEKAAEELL